MRRFVVPFIVGLIVIEAGILFLPKVQTTLGGLDFLKGNATASLANRSLQEHAQDVLAKCQKENKDHFNPGCYDEEIPKLMDYISMEDAFEVTRLVQKEEPRYLYCHVLGHKLSYREAEKDPSKWMDVITRCPTTMCNNGCPHGAMMERFAAETLTDEQIEQLKVEIWDICEPRGIWNPVPVEISMCYHAVGHLFMYVTNADLKKSAALCEFIGKRPSGRDHVQTCTQGVFMQIYQPLEPEDYALVAGLTPTREDVYEFCSKFSGLSFMACHVESWPLYGSQLMDPKGFDAFCSFSRNEADAKTCYGGPINTIISNLLVSRYDPQAYRVFCMGLKDLEQKTACFGTAALRLIQIDPAFIDEAVEVCNSPNASAMKDDCFRRLSDYSFQTFHPGSPEANVYCARLPESWQAKCVEMANRRTK